MAGQGFASQTAQRRKLLGQKGGKVAHQRGTRTAWKGNEAASAAQKASAVRKGAALRRAAIFLKTRFPVEDLVLAGLSVDEYIYYGGSRRTGKRLEELGERIEGLKG